MAARAHAEMRQKMRLRIKFVRSGGNGGNGGNSSGCACEGDSGGGSDGTSEGVGGSNGN